MLVSHNSHDTTYLSIRRNRYLTSITFTFFFGLRELHQIADLTS